MSWESYLSLLESVGGKAERLLPERVAQATAEGHGDAATQMRIAELEYQRNLRKQNTEHRTQNRKEADGQAAWQFG